MAEEIERKFLVDGNGWKDGAEKGVRLTQAYLMSGPQRSLRVRIFDGGTDGSPPAVVAARTHDALELKVRKTTAAQLPDTMLAQRYSPHRFDLTNQAEQHLKLDRDLRAFRRRATSTFFALAVTLSNSRSTFHMLIISTFSVNFVMTLDAL